jgi:hypothetical protein
MRVFYRTLAMTIALAAIPASAQTPAGTLAPRDECADTQGLAALGDKLRRATGNRDAEALLKLVDDDIRLDFGDGSGKPELKARLTSPDYRLWQELDAALALGCGMSPAAGDQEYASWPWYFAKDGSPFDPFEAFIVTGERVRLRAAASAAAPVIGSVSWDYVRLSEYPSDEAVYAEVETRSGEKGYIAKTYLRSLVDYRLIAEKRSGKWRITSFIAGD